MKIHHDLVVETNTDTGAVTIRFIDESGVQQALELTSPMADNLLLGLISSPPQHQTGGNTKLLRAPLLITGAAGRKYEKGLLGLALKLQEGLYVNIAFPPEAIPHLQTNLQNLLTSSPPAVH